MKKSLSLTGFLIALLIAADASAWWWSKKEEKPASPPPPPPPHVTPLRIHTTGYIYDYDDLAVDINNMGEISISYVICEEDDCPPTVLARELTPPPLSIRVSDAAQASLPEGQQQPPEPPVQPDKDASGSGPVEKTPQVSESKVEVEKTQCIVARIYYPFDSSVLSPAEQAKLDQAIDAMHKANISSVDVTGYTCDIGTQGYNDKLAEKRAKAVADYIAARGVQVTNVSGKGKCCYVSDVRRLNRRAEVEALVSKEVETICVKER